MKKEFFNHVRNTSNSHYFVDKNYNWRGSEKAGFVQVDREEILAQIEAEEAAEVKATNPDAEVPPAKDELAISIEKAAADAEAKAEKDAKAKADAEAKAKAKAANAKK